MKSNTTSETFQEIQSKGQIVPSIGIGDSTLLSPCGGIPDRTSGPSMNSGPASPVISTGGVAFHDSEGSTYGETVPVRFTDASGAELWEGEGSILEDFLKEAKEVFAVDNTGRPLCTTTYIKGGGTSELEDKLYRQYRSAEMCGTSLNKLLGKDTGAEYRSVKRCHKWFCPTCGGKKGRIVDRRVNAFLDKVGVPLNQLAVRIIVGTVPADLRHLFRGREGLNRLYKAAKTLSEKHFPGQRGFVTAHLFGEVPGVFHPHFNIVLVEVKEGQLLQIPAEKLAELKETWKRQLRGLSQSEISEVDLFYAFAYTPGKVRHRIRYYLRPIDLKHLKSVKNDVELEQWLIVDMLGFRWVRPVGPWKEPLQFDSEHKEREREAGEQLKFVGTETWSVFKEKYREWDLERLSKDFVRIKNTGWGAKRRC